MKTLTEIYRKNATVLLWMVFIDVAVKVLKSQAAGGRIWAVDSWLINFSGGYVRRGFAGEFIFYLSDVSGIPVLVLTTIFQLTEIFLVFYLFIGMYRKLALTNLTLVLLLSPATLMFFEYSRSGVFRMEQLYFMALLVGAFPLFQSVRRPKIWLFCGFILLVVSMFFHEAIALFAIFFLPVIWAYTRYGWLGRAQAVTVAAILITIAAIAAIFAITHISADSGLMCGDVVRHGLPRRLCSGAIKWEGKNTQDGIALVLQKYNHNYAFLKFFLIYLFLIGPLLHLRIRGFGLWQSRLLMVLGILIMAPLFVVAVDWGRWIHIYIFSLSILAFVGLRLGAVRTQVSVPDWLLVLYVSTAVVRVTTPMTLQALYLPVGMVLIHLVRKCCAKFIYRAKAFNMR